MKIIRNNQALIVVLDNGVVLQNNNCDDTLFNQVMNANSDAEITALLVPSINRIIEERTKINELFDDVDSSEILVRRGNSVYWPEVSELSMPKDFILDVLNAEQEGNENALEGYKNFWTLLSLNPDSRCRENLFWYLNTWGMKISKSGLFIGYRNVDIKKQGNNNYYSQDLCDFVQQEYERIRNMKKGTGHYYVRPISHPGGHTPTFELIKDDWTYKVTDWVYNDDTGEDEEVVVETLTFADLINDEAEILWNLKQLYEEFKAVNFDAAQLGNDTVYTDHHSHTFNIQVGKLVSMPRSSCDSVQEHQCSSGLHLANAEWLDEGYYGTQGLVCLCNPRDVVAVPHDSTYGKLRTCAYLPIALTKYDENGKVIPYNVEDGFESSWVKEVLYSGHKSTEDLATYELSVPDIPEINKSTITQNVLEIARKCINK